MGVCFSSLLVNVTVRYRSETSIAERVRSTAYSSELLNEFYVALQERHNLWCARCSWSIFHHEVWHVTEQFVSWFVAHFRASQVHVRAGRCEFVRPGWVDDHIQVISTVKDNRYFHTAKVARHVPAFGVETNIVMFAVCAKQAVDLTGNAQCFGCGGSSATKFVAHTSSKFSHMCCHRRRCGSSRGDGVKRSNIKHVFGSAHDCHIARGVRKTLQGDRSGNFSKRGKHVNFADQVERMEI